MPVTKTLLSDELQERIEDLAREQKRPPADILDDAVRKYLKEQSWVSFLQRNERRAIAKGITEEDIPRLIEETRREKHQRGV